MFSLAPLPYEFDALAPTISETTLRTHYGKHHARYVETTNKLIDGRTLWGSLEAVIYDAACLHERKLLNNAGQVWNHAFFWSCMTPHTTEPSQALRGAIEANFGGVPDLRQEFIEAGASHFGSGWVWLIADERGLSVHTTHDGGTPVMGASVPLLVCDLWEHAYYLDYTSDRAAFLAAWWDRLLNWDFVSTQHQAARGQRGRWRYADVQAPLSVEA